MQLKHAAREMQNLPFRTNTTWLGDDNLILLDCLFDTAARIGSLRRENFGERWNIGYSHNFNDDELR
jgi:hypothetical protein